MEKNKKAKVISGKIESGKFSADETRTLSMLEAGIELGLTPDQMCKAISSGCLSGFRVGYDWRFHQSALSDYQINAAVDASSGN